MSKSIAKHVRSLDGSSWYLSHAIRVTIQRNFSDIRPSSTGISLYCFFITKSNVSESG